MPAVTQPYPSTYRVPQSPPLLIRSATVLTGTGTRLDAADVLIVDGRDQLGRLKVSRSPRARR